MEIDFEKEEDIQMMSNRDSVIIPAPKKNGMRKVVRFITKAGFMIIKVVMTYLILSGVAANIYYLFIKN